MQRESLEALVEFCAAQHQAFDAWRWVSAPVADTCTLAVTAMFLLGMTQWFGHARELQEIARRLDSRVVLPEGFEEEARAAGFESGRFFSMLRRKLAQANHG